MTSHLFRTAVAAGATVVLGALLVVTAASGASPPPAPDAAVAYRLPVAGLARVVHPFDPPPQPWAAGHRGVDLAAPARADVLAPGDGVVVFAGRVAGRGVVAVAHPDGLRTSLEPVRATVPVGTRLEAGERVGVLDGVSAHCAPVTCLHWGVRRGAVYLDPLRLVPSSGPIVLLPLEGDAVPDAADP
ncbi:murein hydrolase activator EnvC family protein [Cellulomonas alba]|uniref:M23 family metallopeptidase n=1 Tax=Cellulomonas alba TaxID=3053467 RepID=A0ABT7SKL5_9CELL|nr:M23 family metallopeptidase [Cellulomonas alba]MDM7856082.1 M23 family metallopeptidase [Cellulomonas alba]